MSGKVWVARKRPVEVQAMKFDGTLERGEEIIEWAAKSSPGCKVWRMWSLAKGKRSLVIPTLEGEMAADPGDWVIRGVRGEFYPCKPDIFEATYILVEVPS